MISASLGGAPNNRFERAQEIRLLRAKEGSMIGIKHLRFASMHSRVAQPHR
jgi:hypothetical protein